MPARPTQRFQIVSTCFKSLQVVASPSKRLQVVPNCCKSFQYFARRWKKLYPVIYWPTRAQTAPNGSKRSQSVSFQRKGVALTWVDLRWHGLACVDMCCVNAPCNIWRTAVKCSCQHIQYTNINHEQFFLLICSTSIQLFVLCLTQTIWLFPLITPRQHAPSHTPLPENTQRGIRNGTGKGFMKCHLTMYHSGRNLCRQAHWPHYNYY